MSPTHFNIGRSAAAADANPGRERWEWWWRGRTLAGARMLADPSAQAPSVSREFIRRAEIAAELADRALDPIDPLRSGSALQLALTSYRQAAYWALRAHGPSADVVTTLAVAFANAPRELVLQAAGSEQELATLRVLLAERTFVEDAADDDAIALQRARSAQAFVRGLLRLSASPAQLVRRALAERWLRAGSIGLLLAALVLGPIAYFAWVSGPDLAQGKAWRTSSKLFDCQREQEMCGGKRTAIFFHTMEEQNPWFEVDLGAPTHFSVVDVENRKDCCADRALPLVIEVSDDQSAFRVVARRAEPFLSWRARFQPVTARYVRARVERRSLLHLERFSVRER
jgi:hypothetical protein